jgi:hypothetical protein
MSHDVFISHSSKDKVYADAVCSKLEAQGIRCWIAPRDILPGVAWGSAIVEAIENTRLMVLVFSANANASPQIEREVERALNKEVPIIPLRIEAVTPGKSLEYFLGTPHWLDAITPPFEQHLEYIAQTVKALLERGKTTAPIEIPRPPSTKPLPQPPRRRWSIAGAAVLAIALVAALGAWLMHRGAVPSKLIGSWTTASFVGPDKIQFTLTIGQTGGYRYNVVYGESGRIRVSGSQAFLRTADGLERPAGPIVPGFGPPCPANLLAAAPSGVWPLIHRFSQSAKELPRFSPFVLVHNAAAPASTGDQPAVWEWDTAFGAMAWQVKFIFDSGGNFAFTAHALDVGHLEARAGKWTAVSEVLPTPTQGNYYFVGDNSLVMTGSIRGALAARTVNTLWERLGTTQAAPASDASPVMAAADWSPATTAAASPITSPAASAQPPATPASSPSATPPPPPVMALDRHFLVSRDSPVYASPDSSSAVVGHVRRGTYVHITGLTSNWLRVQMSDGRVGFIADRAVE